MTGEGGNFHVYDRQTGAHLGTFRIGSGALTDDVTGMDGIGNVTNVGLGFRFPQGMFVSQDTSNGGANSGNQDFKAVPWQAIANGFPTPLTIDTGFDPRRVGAPDGGEQDPEPDPMPDPDRDARADGGDAPEAAGDRRPRRDARRRTAHRDAHPGLDALGPRPGGTAAFGSRPLVSTGISKRKGLRASRHSIVRVTLKNANPFAVDATVTLATSGGTRLAPTVKLQLQASHRVDLHLSARGRRLLRGHARKAELSVRLRDPRGDARLVTAAFPLRGAR